MGLVLHDKEEDEYDEVRRVIAVVWSDTGGRERKVNTELVQSFSDPSLKAGAVENHQPYDINETLHTLIAAAKLLPAGHNAGIQLKQKAQSHCQGDGTVPLARRPTVPFVA